MMKKKRTQLLLTFKKTKCTVKMKFVSFVSFTMCILKGMAFDFHMISQIPHVTSHITPDFIENHLGHQITTLVTSEHRELLPTQLLSDGSYGFPSFGLYMEKLDKDIGVKIVHFLSSALPKFDSVGHYVLHTNDVLITKVLDNNYLTDEQKKKIVLSIIESSQKGDNMGSKILSFYHDIVERCL